MFLCGDPSIHRDLLTFCRQVAFAPRQLGLVLAAACKDGGVHVLEADRLLAPNAWTVQSTFKAVVRGVWVGGAFYRGGGGAFYSPLPRDATTRPVLSSGCDCFFLRTKGQQSYYPYCETWLGLRSPVVASS